jgi:hypothetical protein
MSAQEKTPIRLWPVGVPTDSDVQRIRDQWPDASLEVGQIIQYEKIESHVGLRRDTHRWGTVIARWRRLVESDSGIIIGTVRGVGFEVLSDSGKLHLGHSKMRSSVRALIRSARVVAHVDRAALPAEEQVRYDRITARQGAFLLADQQRGQQKNLPTI